MTEQIHAIGSIWSQLAGRSLATLGTKLTNDSRFFEKMARGGTCTTKTLEKFLTYFRKADNWPDGMIPQAAEDILGNFENIASGTHAPAECHGADACASDGEAMGETGVHSATDTAPLPLPSTGQSGAMSRDNRHEGMVV